MGYLFSFGLLDEGISTVLVLKLYCLWTSYTWESYPCIKSKESKQSKKIEGKAIITEPADTTIPNPHQVTVEDITDRQPSTEKSLPPSSSEENLKSTPKNLPKT